METHLPPLNSTMRNKKVMWLYTMGRDNQWTDLIAQHLKCCFGRSEMPEQNSSSKYFCIIVLYDCVPKQQVSTSESNDQLPPLVNSTLTTCLHALFLESESRSMLPRFLLASSFYRGLVCIWPVWRKRHQYLTSQACAIRGTWRHLYKCGWVQKWRWLM